jgi:hypothetical protein
MTSAPRVSALSFALLGALPPAARAEVSEIIVAQQYGVSFLPLMEKNALIAPYGD